MANLTTRTRVKQYLNITTSGSDAVIDALIPVASRLIEQYTSRIFPVVTRNNKRLNGTGTATICLPDQPVVSISSISIGTVALAPSAGAGLDSGYVTDGDGAVVLTGCQVFTRGTKNVTVSYVAGYAGQENDTIPTGNTPTLSPTTDNNGNTFGGYPTIDAGVVDSSGSAFTSVANTPAAGQYAFSDGVYTFNASNSGDEVTMSYYYVPSPVEQSCIEMVGMDLRQRTNLGQKSQNLDGQVVTWETRTIPPFVKEMLNPFRTMAPVSL